MAQEGSLYQDHGSWYVRYWQTVECEDGSTKRRNPAHRLGSVKDFPKRSEILPLKNRFMDRLNRIGFEPGSGVSVVDFVENTFLPGCKRRLTEASVKGYRDTWNCHLKSRTNGLRVRDVRPVHIQQILNSIEDEHGATRAHGTYKNMKVTISAIFTEARNLGLYEGTNPATGVRIPKGRRHGRKRLAYSLDEILEHLELFSKGPIIIQGRLPRKWVANRRLRKRINGELVIGTEECHVPQIQPQVVQAIIGVTALGGLRKGEIRGLWWDDDRGDMFSICRSVWNSTVKNTKTDEDMVEPGFVPIIRPLRTLLDAIKPENAAGFIFLNRMNGAIDLDNLAKRVLKPMFKAHGLEWKGWQGYRRGLATNLKELGVEDTTIQAILRHEDVRTTQRFYIKTAPKVAREAMRVLEEKIACTAVVQQLSTN